MIDPKIIKDLSQSGNYKKVLEYLYEEVESLDKVSSLKSNDPKLLAIEVEGRKRAVEILNIILIPLGMKKYKPSFDRKEYDM